MNIGERIAEELRNSASGKILRELEKRPVENSLLIFDLTVEEPERVEIYLQDPKNFMIGWKAFEVPDIHIRAESKGNVKRLLNKFGCEDCTFIVPKDISKPLENREMTKENWLLYTVDKNSFNSVMEHDVERLNSEPEYVRQIASEWGYHRVDAFIEEMMEKYPFFGIKAGKRLASYAGAFAKTQNTPCDTMFLGFAHTEEEFRRQGMMKSVVSALTEEVLKQNRVPASYIVEDNTPSIRAVEQLGFHPIATHVKFYPKITGLL